MNTARVFWIIFYAVLLLLLGLLIKLAILPAYTSPASRLWSTQMGYPALLRKQGKAIPVTTARVSERTFTRIISAEGLMRYLEEVSVNIEVPGIISSVDTELGALVERGQTLLTLDTGGHQTRLAKFDRKLRQTEFNKSKADFLREQDAYKKGLIALTDLQEYKNIYQQATIALHRAKEFYAESLRSRSTQVIGRSKEKKQVKNNQIPILAPVSGRVIQLAALAGENLVVPKSGVAKLGVRLVFQAHVDQRHFGELQHGEEALVYLKARPEQPFHAKIIRIAPSIISSSARNQAEPSYTFHVWMELKLDTLHEVHLAAGMNGYCVLRKPMTSLAIPVQALLYYSGGKGQVLSINEQNEVALNRVSYAVSSDGWVAIQQGLQAGMQVITSAQTGLRAGDQVVAQ